MNSVLKFTRDIIFVGFFLVLFIFIGYSFSPQYTKHIVDIDHKLLLLQQQTALSDTYKMIKFSSAGLDELLKEVPLSARDSVQIIQTNLNAVPPILRFSTIAFMNRPGHSPTVIANALPIFQWRDYLGNMIDHKCTYIDANNLSDPDAKTRISSFAFGTIACPIITPNNQIIGIIAMSFDKAEDIPCQKNCGAGVLTMEEVFKINEEKALEFGKYFSNNTTSIN